MLVQNATTATQRSGNATAIVSAVPAHREAGAALVDYAAERTRSRFRGIQQLVALWLRRRRDRAMLRSLSRRDIHDFCPRLTEAEAEMNKPFWRA